MQDTEISKTCPRDIVYGKPPIVIANNDSFKFDTLTGNATYANQTNVLYVQPELHEEESNNDSTTAQNITKMEVSKELDVKREELKDMQKYVCP